MRLGANVATIIPAFNEESSIGKVISAIPHWVDDVIVVDNGSTDKTSNVAEQHGATVLSETRRGYGSACLKGIAGLDDPDVVLFMDGDFSDYPEEASLLVDPIIFGRADMVIGSRVMGRCEAGALTPQALLGNWLTCKLMRFFGKARFTDLGPFRAISLPALRRLEMRDPDFGWTVEMQIKAVRDGLDVHEVPVSYRRRIGKSKVSGTVRGVVGAGTKILGTILLGALGGLPSTRASGDEIIIFTRFPEPGKTKTRLIPVLGAEGAADLQRRMAEHVLAEAQDLAARREVSLEVCYEGGNEALLSRWLGSRFSYSEQRAGDLGTRMHTAFKEGFLKGNERVLIIGTDCPGLTDKLLETALEDLREHDVVLGPARDGGYYLIGLKRLCPSLFHDIQWGTHDVLAHTLEVVHRNGLSVKLVELMNDVDRPEDLEAWDRNQKVGHSGLRRLSHSFDSERHAATPAIISVVIPTLNEAHILAAALETVSKSENVEVIIADGGSTDETMEIARAYNVRSLQVPACRAAQMNAGAKEACGDILLFLHADTRLPRKWANHVRSELDKPRVAGGAFTLKLDENARWCEIIEGLANMRSRRLHMPYGDQAIFIRTDLFHGMGGFAALPIMEDFEFMRRLRKRGCISIVPEPVVTSARRWRESGVWWTTAVNQAVIIGYFLGISPHLLARLYHFKSRRADRREVSRRKSFT